MLQIPVLRRLIGAHDAAFRAEPSDGLPGRFISMCMPATLRPILPLGVAPPLSAHGEEDGRKRRTTRREKLQVNPER